MGREDLIKEKPRVLLVAATLLELGPFIKRRNPQQPYDHAGQPGTIIDLGSCDLLISGVGQLQCAVHVSRTLAASKYSLVVQAGIAGSFTAQHPIRSVVTIVSEVCSDLGAEDNGGLLHLSEMGLLDPHQPPFVDGELVAPEVKFQSLARIPHARSVTVNRVLSETASINWVRTKFAPEVVNMEGAALFYAGLLAEVPFVQVRAISDMVGPRDKTRWDIPGAISALDPVIEELMAECSAG